MTIRPVKAIVLKPTYLCNQRCIMCPHVGRRTSATTMTWEEAETNLVELKRRYKPRRLEIVGGEPTLYPDLDKILQWLDACWSEVPVHVFTNGLRLSKLLAQMGPYAETVIWNVAVHAPDEQTNAAITMRHGVFERLLTSLDVASDRGLALRIDVAVLAQNSSLLMSINDVISRYKVSHVSYRLPILARDDFLRFKPDVASFVSMVTRATSALSPATKAEIILAPRCFEADVPVNVEDGEVVLVDKHCPATSGGRRKSHYDDAIIQDLSQRRFCKPKECLECMYEPDCSGIDGVYLEDLGAAGVSLRPITNGALDS